jgi:environmental stress-induced protein Ves
MTATLIPFAGLAVSPWRNGAGRKADIAAGPDWLVGFAWLDADAPFSDYGGHDRTITLIEGPGFTLDFGPSHPALVARRPYVPSAFDGGWAAQCRVPDGPCLVLNAMTTRATRTHSVSVAPAAALAPPAPGGVAFLVVLEGRVAIEGQTAGPRDAFRIADTATPHAGADARAALIRIDPIRPGV